MNATDKADEALMTLGLLGKLTSTFLRAGVILATCHLIAEPGWFGGLTATALALAVLCDEAATHLARTLSRVDERSRP